MPPLLGGRELYSLIMKAFKAISSPLQTAFVVFDRYGDLGPLSRKIPEHE